VPIAAVVVLSPEFVRKKYTMLELKMFLERKARDPHSMVIIPVFLGLTVEQCYNLEQLYDSNPWPTSPSMPTVERAVLQGWAADVKQILESTGVKIEEVSVTCDGYAGCTQGALRDRFLNGAITFAVTVAIQQELYNTSNRNEVHINS
jgi:hypothetical protein